MINTNNVYQANLWKSWDRITSQPVVNCLQIKSCLTSLYIYVTQLTFFLQYEHWASTVRKEMEFWGNSIDDSNQMLCKHAIRWGIDENRILHRQAASLWGFFYV